MKIDEKKTEMIAVQKAEERILTNINIDNFKTGQLNNCVIQT